MQKYIKMLLTVVLVFAIILSMATGVMATEQEHVHNWQCVWSNDQMHNVICSGCSEEKTTTHSKDSEGVCTVCGHAPHEHVWQYTQGENYDYNHGLHCTQCAATSQGDHIYGNDGKCTVCDNSRPHEHQWEWDGNESNYLHIHFLVCSCGAATSEDHHLVGNDTSNDKWPTVVCDVCGYTVSYTHSCNPVFFDGERCSLCGYQPQGTTESETKPSETKPEETEPVETIPVETETSETLTEETGSSETKPNDTEAAETEPTDTKPTPEETMPENGEGEGLQRSYSVWVWVAAALGVSGVLGVVVFFLIRKPKVKNT